MLKINSTTTQTPNFCAEQRIPFALARQSRYLLIAMQEVNPSMQKLNKAVNCSGARKVIDIMKKTFGLDAILQDGGLSLFIGDKTIKIFSPNPMLLKIKEQSTKNRKDFKYIELQNDKVLESQGFNSISDSIEEFLNSVFEKLDFPLLQIRKFLREAEIEQVLKKISPKAVLNENTAKITDDIKNLFNEVQERISSVKNMATRSKIKNGYPSAKPSIHGSKQLEFSRLGVEEEDYSVNIVTKSADEKYLVVKINKEGQDEQVIIVDQKHRALKEKNLGRVHNLGSTAVFYTQQEVNSPLFALKLEVLKRELENYNKYLKETIANFNEYKSNRTTDDVGVIDKKTLSLIKDIMRQFDGCKAKMLKIKDAPRKNAFKQKYGIETRMSSPSLIFKNANEQGESLHLSFPTMSGVRCMKIVIEKLNGNIGKSFFVNGDKLVKFNATTLGRSKRADVGTYYYSQEEIASSGLNEYLQILKKRLKAIPKSE